MLRLEQWMDLHVLHKQGHSIRAIAELSVHARNTVRKILGQTTPKAFQKPQQSSQLDPFKGYLTAGWRRHRWLMSTLRHVFLCW